MAIYSYAPPSNSVWSSDTTSGQYGPYQNGLGEAASRIPAQIRPHTDSCWAFADQENGAADTDTIMDDDDTTSDTHHHQLRYDTSNNGHKGNHTVPPQSTTTSEKDYHPLTREDLGLLSLIFGN